MSTFGHGSHTCPAQRFSISAIRTAVQALLDRYELEPEFTHPGPLARQIGGVARADRPTPIRYRLRTSVPRPDNLRRAPSAPENRGAH